MAKVWTSTTKLEAIEGIGAVKARKLRKVGVRSIPQLLEQGSTPQGRQDNAKAAGIKPSLILEWANHADLFRIKGVGEEYADLLEAAGVDTVVELGKRNPKALYPKLVGVNAAMKLVRKLPGERQIGRWICQAQRLPRILKY